VADGTGIAERSAFHSFISGQNWSAFDELVRQGRAQNFAEATRLVADRTGIALPLPAVGSPGGGTSSPVISGDASGFESRKLTDLGNAMLFKSHHDEGVFYDPAADWRVWDGRRWKLDSDGEVERRAYRTARSLYREAAQTSDPEQSQAIARWAMKSQARERLNAIAAVAKPLMAIDPARLDAEPWVLNVQNGMIDLMTGNLLPHDRRRLCTRVCPVDFDAQARSDLFDRVLADALPDESVRTYFQKVCGLTLIGEQVEDLIVFAHGPEATAKTTLIEPLKKLFGDYAVTVEPETLMSTRNGGGGAARGDIARLAGTRLAITTETEDGTRFAASLLKRLSGNDTITARHIYKKDFEFRPSCTIWIVSNHRPKADAMDGGLWRRLKVIPFIRQIPKERRDPSVKKGMLGAECLRAMLAWAVAGCLLYQREGLVTPEAIEKATDDYRESMDPMGDFIKECCVLDPSSRVDNGHLRTAYMDYCADNGIRFTLSPRQWGERLRALGFEQFKSGGTRGWRGISVKISEVGTMGQCGTSTSLTFPHEKNMEKVTQTHVPHCLNVPPPPIDLLDLDLDDDDPEE
jgi:putative DNA primase/helicase